MSAGRREVAAAAACLAVLAVACLAAAGVFSSAAPRRAVPSASATIAGADVPAVTAAPQRAIRRMLRRRSAAVVHHDRRAFLATVDPAASRFRRAQASMFANLRRVRFASWAYVMGDEPAAVPQRVRSRETTAVWAPASFTLRYRLAHFDRHATQLPQYPTFVRRAHRWYLASLSDFRRRGKVSATDLWDYAAVHVVHRPGVLALGPAGQLATMRAAATLMQAAIPKVTSVWGRHWARRVVVLVPGSQHEMARIDTGAGDLDRIAALTSSEIRRRRGAPAPVGDRVTVNPANWPRLGTLGASIVLAHELTHVATRADTGAQTPKWLSEGFAEYVGFLGTGVPTGLAAAELAARARGGHPPTRLPSDRAFRGANPRLSAAYELAWLVCRHLAERYGQSRLVRFYRAVGTARLPTGEAVSRGLHRVFGLDRARFDRQWRAYVGSALG